VRRLVPALLLVLVAFVGCLVAACAKREQPPPERAAIAQVEPSAAPIPLAVETRVRESSGIALAKLGERLIAFVADGDDHAVLALDASTLEPLAHTELEGAPRDLLIAASGEIVVTIPERNLVVALAAEDDRGTLHEARRRWVSTEPIAMAATPDDATILVTAGAGHRLDALDAKTLERRWSTSVAREPRAVIVSRDGKRAFVSHASDERLSVVPLDGMRAEQTIAMTSGGGAATGFRPDPPRFARHANAIVRTTSGGRDNLVLPVAMSAPEDFYSIAGYGGASGRFTPAAACSGGPTFGRSVLDLQQIDEQARKRVARYEFESHEYVDECQLPRAAIAEGTRALVACFGQSAVLEIGAEGRGWAGVVRRFAVPRGPSAIARVSGAPRALVWSPLAREVAAIDLDAKYVRGGIAALATRAIERKLAVDADVLRGREIFHRTGDRRISQDGIACATCHPDGRDDGLVWETPRGKRRPMTLAAIGERDTRFGWGAENMTMEVHIAETVRRLGGTGLPPDDVYALRAYVRSMKPVPRAEPEPEEIARRGERVFFEKGCGACHEDVRAWTDHTAHDIGSGGALVTPSLLGVGARTSLFHDGRYPNVSRVVFEAKTMGQVDALSLDERTALAAFLSTL
jgi:mono/diheme cytochrome c family protein